METRPFTSPDMLPYDYGTPLTWSMFQPHPAAPASQPSQIVFTDCGSQPMQMDAGAGAAAQWLSRPQSAGSQSLEVKLMALKRRQMETRRLPWAGAEGGVIPSIRLAHGSWISSTMPRPNTCEGHEGSALQRQASSPAALTTARSLSSLHSSIRPGTALSGSSSPSHGEALELSAEQLSPCGSPAEDLQCVLTVLGAAKQANRLNLDWQAQLKAMNDARRLVRFHPEHVLAQLHALLWLVAPAMEDLRSVSAKVALTFLMECCEALGHNLDPEVEALVPLLIKRAGAASAGRDNFLAAHADRVLSAMMSHTSPLRFVIGLLAAAALKGPKTRWKVAAYLDGLLQSEHGSRLAVHPSMPERLLRMANSLLEEGQLETRTHAKRAIAQLRQLLDDFGPPRAFEDLTARVSGDSASRERYTDSSSPSPPASPSKHRSMLRGVQLAGDMRRSSSLNSDSSTF